MYHKKCQCPNILLCVCPVAEKCSLMLADFDYICKIGTEPHRREGTLTYRSPELEVSATSKPCIVVVVVVVTL